MITPDLRSDYELFLLLQQGDRYAYTEIFKRYSRLLVAHAYRLLGDKEAAHDIVQDIMLALWQKRETLQLHTSLSAYLYTATRNRIFDQISRQQVIDRYTDSIMQFIEKGGLPDERVIEKELVALIEKEIELLPEKARQAFILRKKQELGYAEIADELGITEAAAKQQVYNAVKALRLKLSHFITLLVF